MAEDSAYMRGGGVFTHQTWLHKSDIWKLFREPKESEAGLESNDCLPSLPCAAYLQPAAEGDAGRVAIAGRCRSRLSRLFSECHAVGPSSLPLSPGRLVIHSYKVAGERKDLVARAPVLIRYSRRIR